MSENTVSSVFSTEDSYRDFRVNQFLERESGSPSEVQVVPSGDGRFVLDGVSSQYDADWARPFENKREARRAQIQYILFSPPPLNAFLKDISSVDKWRNNPDVRRIWQRENPSEPFNTKNFRRLLMVAMLKKMNPETYGDLSYHAIAK